MSLIVFDLDSTLADDSHRLGMIIGVARKIECADRWERYWGECVRDTPKPAVIAVFRALMYSAERYDLEIWTGRSERVRAQTEDWLSDHVFKGNWWRSRYASLPSVPVRMRAEIDWGSDLAVKSAWYSEVKASGRTVDMAFEDRPPLVEFWRGEGVEVFQVGGAAL